MKRVYFCIFILMAVVAVAFFSLVRVSRGSERLKTGIDGAVGEYRRTGEFPEALVTDLNDEWEGFYKSISYAENTDELGGISGLFTELKVAKDYDDFKRAGELIKTALTLMRENETPYLYSLM